jgi:hypothetical protein
MALPTANNIIQRAWDDVTKNLGLIESDHREVHKGEMYVAWANYASLADGGTASLVLVTGAKYVHLKDVDMWISSAEGHVEFYENVGTVANTASVFTAQRMNRAVAGTSTVTVYTDGSVDVSSATQFNEVHGGGGGTTAAGRSGAQAPQHLENILEPNTRYSLTLINESGVAANCFMRVFWYEEDTI